MKPEPEAFTTATWADNTKLFNYTGTLERDASTLARGAGTPACDKGRSPLTKGRRPLTRFLKRKALVPWCPGFGAGENLPRAEPLTHFLKSKALRLPYPVQVKTCQRPILSMPGAGN